jgi:hypothetical protein
MECNHTSKLHHEYHYCAIALDHLVMVECYFSDKTLLCIQLARFLVAWYIHVESIFYLHSHKRLYRHVACELCELVDRQCMLIIMQVPSTIIHCHGDGSCLGVPVPIGLIHLDSKMAAITMANATPLLTCESTEAELSWRKELFSNHYFMN